MTSDLDSDTNTDRRRRRRDGDNLCVLLVLLLGLAGGVVAATDVGALNGGLGASGSVFVGLAGLATGGNGGTDDAIGRLVERIERVEAGEDDVDFETDREDQIGRLYDAVGSLVVSAGPCEQRAAEQYRQELYHVTSDAGLEYGEKVQRLLELGCERLDVESGFVTSIDEGSGRHEVETVVNGGFVEACPVTDPEEGVCGNVIASNDILGVSDAREDGVDGDADDGGRNVGSYIGGKIEVDGELAGTLCFVDADPRPCAFTHDERLFVDLLTRWASNELERRDHAAELRLLDRALESAPVGVTMTDPAQDDNPIVYANERFRELTGYPPEETIGRNCRFLQGEETADEPVAAMRAAVAAEEPVTTELRNYRRDGTEFWNRVSIAPVENEAGEVTNFVGFQEDVTDRKTAQCELERYAEFTDEMLDAVDDVFYVLDEDGYHERWNETLTDVLGYTDEEVASMHALEAFDESERRKVSAAIRAVFETGGAQVEAAYVTADGERVPYEFVASALDDPDGNRVIAGIGRDISERKEKERQLSRLIDNVPGYVYRSDATSPWELAFVSEGVRDIAGYDPERLESGAVEWDADVVAEESDRLEAQIETALADREPFHLTYPIETADGARRWVKEQGRGVYAADGSAVGIEGVVTDVTEQRIYEQELERTTDLLEQAGRIASVGGWELDLTTDPPETTWTDELYDIHGIAPGTEIDVETVSDRYHPDDREYIQDRLRAAIDRGEGYDMEVRLLPEGDETRWVRAMGEAVYEDGEVAKLRGSIQDITEQKEREQELRATKDRLQKFIETSPVGVVANDPDGVVTLWNDGMEEIFGWEEAEVLGEPYPAVPDDASVDGDAVRQRALDGEPVSQVELERVRKDGRRIDVSLSMGLIRDESGTVTELVGYIEEITERKERERELERTKDLLAQAERLANVGGWEVELGSANDTVFMTDELCRLYGIPPGTALDLDKAIEFYHPDDRQQVRDAVQNAIEAGERYDVEARLQTAEGEQRWVRAIGQAVEADGEVARHRGSLQDVTEQKEHELALKSLHDAARGLLQTQSESEVTELAVETAASLFDVPGVGVYAIDEASNRLVPTAVTDGFEALSGGAPAVAVGDGSVIWNCFATGERAVFDASEDARDSKVLGGGVDSGLLVPMGDHGVFVVATDGPQIDDETRRLAETLVATTEAAFDRLAREADLRKRDAELEAQNQRLRRHVQINDIIRRVDQSLVGATSREEVESAVCDRLVESDDVAFAWIGGFDGDGELVPHTWAGAGQTYLDTLALDRVEGAAEPAVATARTGEATVVSNVVDRLREDGWRRGALANGFHSVVSVPLSVEDYSHGVLAVYADQPNVFDGLEREVFAELGRSIANAIDAVSAREALHSDTVVELTLAFDEPDGVLARVARDADCEVEYEGISTRSADETRLFFATTGASAAAVEAVLDGLYAVTDSRLVSETDDRYLFEATVSGPELPSALVDQGASPRSIRATPTGTKAVVDLPTSSDVREFVETLRESFPSVELGSRRNVERGLGTRQQLLASLLEELTDRQLEVLRTAYFAGFFEWPRASTGEEVAEMLGVTQPTVNRHLRLGQQRLLAQLFDEEAPDLVAA